MIFEKNPCDFFVESYTQIFLDGNQIQIIKKSTEETRIMVFYVIDVKK